MKIINNTTLTNDEIKKLIENIKEYLKGDLKVLYNNKEYYIQVKANKIIIN